MSLRLVIVCMFPYYPFLQFLRQLVLHDSGLFYANVFIFFYLYVPFNVMELTNINSVHVKPGKTYASCISITLG